MRKADGSETLLDKSESVVPVESLPISELEDEEPEEATTVGDEKEEDRREGFVVRRVIRRPLFVTSQRTVVRRVEIGEDGGEREVGHDVVESEKEVETTEPIVTHRTVKRVAVAAVDGDIDERVPLEIVRTDRPEGEEAEEEIEGEVKRIVRRRSITRTQRRVVRRMVERDDGSREGVEEVEDEVMLPVEVVGHRVVRRRIVRADKTEEVVTRTEYDLPVTEETRERIEEVKDEETGKERRVIRRPVPVVTVRKVYRTIIITESGEEMGSEESVEVEEEEVGEAVEEPTAEVIEPIEETRRVERRETEVVTRRQVFRREVTKRAVDETEEEEIPVPEPDGVALEVEALPEVLPGELSEEEPEEEAAKEESEDRLRRVVRRPVHVTSRRTVIRKFVAASADEETGEVEEEEAEDKGETVYPRRIVVRRPVIEEESEETEEEEEPITEPEEYVPEESVPSPEWDRFPADVVEEEARPERRIVRQPVVEVSSRRVYRKIDVRKEVARAEDTTERIVDEDVVPEPTAGDVHLVEEYPEDAVQWDEPEEPEEPEEVEETVITTRRQVFRTKLPEEPELPAPAAKVEEEEGEDEKEGLLPPRRVERLYVRRILRKADGSETLLDKSESVVPVESLPISELEDEEPEEATTVGDEKEEDRREGFVVRRVIRRPLFVTSQRTVVRRVEIGEDGGEREVGHDVVESEKEVETTEPIVTHRTVKRVAVAAVDGDIDERVPLEIVRTDRPEGEEAEEEIEGEVKRIVRRRSITRTQRRVVRRMVERDDGSREGVEEVEDEVMLPVEVVGHRVVRRRIVRADKTEEVVTRTEYDLPVTEETRERIEEVKDEETGKERRVIRRPVPVVTVRKVYRTIIITESGEEMGSEESVEVEEEEVGEAVEEPTAEVIEPIEETRRVERRETEVVTRRQVFRREVTKRAVDETEEEEIPVPEPDGVALEVEALPEVLPGELSEEEPEEEAAKEESEDRLRRVVRRPVHVTSRRTVIRKFVAASADEETGEVEEEEAEDKGETVYPRRIVVRRPVIEEESEETEEEEEPITEPEEYVPEESVPSPEWDRFPADVVEEEARPERRIVRQPVVEVSSRRVYRKIDVRKEVARAEDTTERIVDEDVVPEPTAGDVHLVEEYPEDAVQWDEPEEPEEPEEVEETVITTRRQVFRTKLPEEPELPAPAAKVEEEEGEDEKEGLLPPRRVERLYVRRILRKADGSETLLDKSESVVPVESLPISELEDEEPEEATTVGDEKEEDRREGFVVRRVIRRPLFVTSQRTVVRRVEIGEDGGEREVGHDVVESEKEVETTEPIVTHRTVKRVAVAAVDGDIDERVPLEIVRTDRPEGEEAEEEIEGEVKRIVRRRSITRTQRRVVRRMVERDDGSREGVEEVEDEVMLPVEVVGHRVVRRRIVRADKTEEVVTRTEYDLPVTEETRERIEEVKDEETGKERRVIRRPVPVVTVRKVYRTIIITESGEEMGSEESVEVEEEEVGEAVEEPTAEVIEPIEETRRVERRETEVVTRRQVFRREVTKRAVDETEEEEIPVPEPDGVALEVEALPEVLPGELSEEEPEEEAAKEESEDRLRRVVRRPVHVTSRRTVIRKFVAASADEETGEVEEEEAEDKGETVYPRRIVVRRPVIEEESEETEEEEEPITEPEEYVPEESVPSPEWDRFPADVVEEEARPERRIVRQPVVEVSSRRVYRKIDVRKEVARAEDTTERIVDEDVVPEPTAGDVHLVEEYPEDAVQWDEPEEPEEPEEVEETVITTRRQVFRTKLPEEPELPAPAAKVEEEEGEDEKEGLLPPRRVERLYVRRILRKADGSETLLDKSESVVPVESLPISELEDEEPEEATTVGDEKEEDRREGFVVRRVIRRPLFVTSQRTVVRRVEIGEDGGEREVGHDVVESEKEVETTEPIVTHRTVKRVAVAAVDGDIDERVPLEIVRTDRPEGEEAEEEIEGEVKRIVRRRSITRTQRRVVRRMVERDDGSREGVEEVEDEVMLPVEVVGHRVVRRRIVRADKTEEVVTRTEYDLPVTEETRERIEEVKDEETGKERRVIRRPVPVVTVRKVYRTIIITESGEEMGSEESVEVEEEEVGEAVEEPTAEVIEPIEETRRVERRETEVVTRRQVFRREVTKRAVDETEEEEIPVPEPDGVALEVEALPEVLPGELSEEEPEEEAAKEESEDRLRRVVRRPVHVTSRRTVIRKFVAASADEETGEVEEEEAEDKGETVYPRRIVVRRPVIEEESEETEEEEEPITEPEEYVPEESVPSPEWDRFPADVVEEEARPERRIVRQPVVEVSSRRVYRKIDVRKEVARAEDTTERIVDEDVVPEPTAGDVHLVEEYPEDAVQWDEPEEPEEPEEVEETVITTRRQVFRTKLPEEPELPAPAAKVEEEEGEDEKEGLLPPRRVERLYVRRILRKADGSETLLDKSESVVPVESLPISELEDEEPEEATTVGDEKEEDRREGFVVRRVIRRPLFVTSQRTVVRRVEIGEDGGEREVGHDVVESEKEVETTEPIVTHRTVKRVAVAAVDGDIDERVPLEIVRTDRPEGEEAEEEIEGEVKRIVRRRSITRTQRRVVRRMVERDDGSREGVEEVEDEVMLPVEVVGHRVVRRRIVRADKTEEVVTRTEYDLPVTEETRERIEEVKDEETGKERRVIRRPVPVVTVRKVYRTIIITESGEEMGSEESVEVEEEEVGEAVEEPTAEVIEPIEETRRVERRETEVVTRRQVFRREVTKRAVDETEEEEIPVPEPDGVALEVEALPEVLPGELSEEEPEEEAAKEESEDRLRRVVRRPVHVTSRRTVIRKFVAASADEETGEVEEEEAEDKGETVYPRRIVVRRPVIEEESEETEEEEEPITEPEEYVPEESVPSPEWDRFPADVVEEEARPERRIVRQPVVEVSSRRVYRKIDVRKEVARAEDTTERIVDEDVVPEPTAGDVHLVEEYPEDAVQWDEPEEPEEPEEVEETVITTRRQVFRTKLPEEPELPAPAAKVEEEEGEDEKEGLLPPRRVERLYVRRILRKADGSETLLDKSESVVPVESLPISELEDEEPEEATTVGDEKEEDRREGFVVRRVIRRPLFVTSQRTVVRRVEIGEDGGEREVGHDVVESEKEVETTEPIVTHRTVKRVAVAAVDGDIDERVPLEIVRTDRPEGEEAEEEIEGEVKRIVRRRSITRTQRRVVRRMVERDDGSREGVEEVEDEVMLPVEVVGHRVVRRRIVRADKTEEVVTRTEYDLPVTEETRERIEEVKDEETGKERRVIRRPVPVVTVRKVYRTIIITESGEEMGSEESVEVEEEEVGEAVEEPTAEVIEPIEETRRVERRETEVVTRRQVFRREVTKRAVDETEEEEIPVPEPDGVALEVEALPEVLPGELSEEEPEEEAAKEESEDRLRRVVRRPVHVTSRRTVIRKFVAASADEETGEVEEEEAEDKGETVYPRRIVVRRPVIEEESEETEEEEEPITEPEEYVPEESVPSPEWDRFPADVVEEEARPERRIVRQPVVEVSSRRVYRKIDVRKEVARAEDTTERIVDEDVVPEPTAGDVHLVEEYPEDAVQWDEPEEPEEPEEVEETVITTRRQVFRTKLLLVPSGDVSEGSDGGYGGDVTNSIVDVYEGAEGSESIESVKGVAEVSSISGKVVKGIDKTVTVIRPDIFALDHGDGDHVSYRRVFRKSPQNVESSRIVSEVLLDKNQSVSVESSHVDEEVYEEEDLGWPKHFGKVKDESVEGMSSKVAVGEQVVLPEVVGDYTEITLEDAEKAEELEEQRSKKRMKTFVYRKVFITYKTVLVRKFVDEFGKVLDDDNEIDELEEAGFRRHDGDDDNQHGMFSVVLLSVRMMSMYAVSM